MWSRVLEESEFKELERDESRYIYFVWTRGCKQDCEFDKIVKADKSVERSEPSTCNFPNFPSNPYGCHTCIPATPMSYIIDRILHAVVG